LWTGADGPSKFELPLFCYSELFYFKIFSKEEIIKLSVAETKINAY
jgi:hypothetical protein